MASKKSSLPNRWECANCSLPGQPGIVLRPCSRCKLARYCGKECQAQHWKKGGHKQYCLTPEERKPQQTARWEGGTVGPSCAICIESLTCKDVCRMVCSHVFHAICVARLVERSSPTFCPVCRAALKEEHLIEAAAWRDSMKVEAEALELKGDLVGAERVYREVVQLDPTLVWAQKSLCAILFKKWNGVTTHTENRTACAQLNVGNILLEKGDLAGAVREYRKAINLDSSLAPAHFHMGHLCEVMGEPAEAEQEIREALKRDPRQADAHDWLAFYLELKGDLAGAEKELRESLKLNQSINVHNRLGKILRDKGDTAGSENEFRKAIQLKPGATDAHFNLGVVLIDKGDLVGAEREIREAIKLGPNYPKPHHILGVLLFKAGDLAGAKSEFCEAIEVDLSYAAARADLGALLIDKGDLAGAKIELCKAIELDQTSAGAHHSLGVVLMLMGDLLGAEREVCEAIKMDLSLVGAHHTLGEIRKKAKGAANAWSTVS